MALNFTTGIPEIDRLTGSKVENGSFLLITGNDDEGMSAFLAEIEKSNGRPAGEENAKNTKTNGCEIRRIDSFIGEEFKGFDSLFSECCVHFKCGQPLNEQHSKEESPEKQIRTAENDSKRMEIIVLIESLSELFQTQTVSNVNPSKTRKMSIISLIKEIKSKNPKRIKLQTDEGVRFLIIGCLHQKILSKRTENRLIHLADGCFQFRMEQRNDKFEREILIWKYKGGDAGGNIIKYTIERGKIRIENKKRIY